MTISKAFSRLCPDIPLHNTRNADNAIIREGMRNGNIEKTDNGYKVGTQEFKDSNAAARYIQISETTYPENENTQKKVNKEWKIILRLVVNGEKIALWASPSGRFGRFVMNGKTLQQDHYDKVEENFDRFVIIASNKISRISDD